MKELEEIIERLPKFTGEENYWIVSTGKVKELYNYFNENNLIALAWDKISVYDIIGKNLDEIKEIVILKYGSLRKNYKDDGGFKKAMTILAKEMHFFANDMKEGDIVLVKNKANNKLMFGKVISDVIEANEKQSKALPIDSIRGNCNKIRRIEWLKSKDNNLISDRIKNGIRVQQAIVKIENNDLFINDVNKAIYTLFTRKGYIHATFNINYQEDIDFENYYNFLSIIHKFRNENKIEDNFYIRSNVSSPGPVEIYGTAAAIVTLLGAFGLLKGQNNGRYEDELKDIEKSLDMETPKVPEDFDIEN